MTKRMRGLASALARALRLGRIILPGRRKTERPCRSPCADIAAPPEPANLMYLVAIAWLYVALMMAVAEAVHSQGSVLGAVFTFLLYGLGPVALMMYLLGTPARRKARRRAEAAQTAQAAEQQGNARAATAESSGPLDPDGSGQAPAAAEPGPVAPVREEA